MRSFNWMTSPTETFRQIIHRQLGIADFAGERKRHRLDQVYNSFRFAAVDFLSSCIPLLVESSAQHFQMREGMQRFIGPGVFANFQLEMHGNHSLQPGKRSETSAPWFLCLPGKNRVP